MPATAIEAIEQLMRSLAWPGLAHSVWSCLAVPALAALMLRARPGLGSKARHDLLLGALLLATAAPFAWAAAHRATVRGSGRGPERTARAIVSAGSSGAARPVTVHVRSPADIRLLGASGPAARAVRALARAVRPYVLACWASGLAGVCTLIAVASGSSARLRRRARPAPEAVGEEARRLGRRLGLRRCPPVLVHDALTQPCLCGVIRPAVIVPAGWLRAAKPGVVAAVLAHELAHARRRDPLVNLFQRFLEALVLFHPGACWLSRSLRRLREHRADAIAVRLTGDPVSLAEALAGFAQTRLAPDRRGPLGATLGGESTALLPRIREILGMKPNRTRTGPWPVIALPVAGLIALLVANAGLARDDPPAEAARPAARPLPAADRQIDGPSLSYVLRVVEASATGPEVDTDFEVRSGGDRLGLSYLSDVEVSLMQRSLQRDPSARVTQAPKVTVSNGQRAFVWAPSEQVVEPNDDDIGTAIALSGEPRGRSIRLSIWLEESARDKAIRVISANGPGVRCTLPEGGNVLLKAEAPALGVAEGRQRLILVTPRRIPPERKKGGSSRS